ncbi:hypothetical protein BGZ65_010039 [Modicella reniformis]|uniref:THIF-type NAD/FAD binding fold domain-containing protein n=1 Tax=Modicella reniformis TaxID=1440133 RepID=A0A9P6MAQ8_9FUNG|nr:hypothetical protein BGZ65_010039 [Modicella reniformis]
MALVAVAASVATTAVLLGYQGSQRKQRSRHLKNDLRSPPSRSTSTAQKLKQSEQQHYHNHHHDPIHFVGGKVQFDEELIQEQLARNIAFLGEEGVQRLRESFVIVVGSGSIGSWAASMLIKSGVGKIRIIDYDQISLSGLNQHATATRADVGTPKVIAMKKYLRMIAPWAEVDICVERLYEDCVERLLSGNPAYVVDTLGDLGTKLQLLKYCHEHSIPVISSMGAGAKADPSHVQIGDISETFEDPFATVVRRRLKRLDVDWGVEVVYSTEKPYLAEPTITKVNASQQKPHDSDKDDEEYTPLANFSGYSEAILPILMPLPAMFGMSMATFIICKIAGWAMEPLPIKFRMELYQRLHRDLKAREDELSSTSEAVSAVSESSSPAVESSQGTLLLSRRDIGYVVEEMFKSKSAVSGSMDQIVVCRWRRDKPLSLLNTVVLTEKEREKHLALPIGADLEEVYGKDVIDFVESRFREEEQISRL